MKKPTDKQIEAEIKKLKKMKPNVRQFSMFGDDHHAAIDAQINVLDLRLSVNDVYTRFEYAKDNIKENAEIAAQWREDGEFDGMDKKIRTPSDTWKSLLVK